MKFYVHFSTIQPRFDYINDVLTSWNNQSVNIEKVIISCSKLDKRLTNPNRLSENIRNHPKAQVQFIDYDYGPHNKILGALQFFESLPDKDDCYVIICDDDCIYTKNITKSYKESITENRNTIYTHFETKERLKNINHIQGADTYLLIPEFFNTTTFDKYKQYLDEVIKECEDCLYQDDYVISYYIYKYCNLSIHKVKNIGAYFQANCSKICQLHLDPKVHEREKNTISYFQKKLTS